LGRGHHPRRLAATSESSQPVVYSHFVNKEGIGAAVAIPSFTNWASGWMGHTRRHGSTVVKTSSSAWFVGRFATECPDHMQRTGPAC
jgi:hypothetical protein